MEFRKVQPDDTAAIKELSAFASSIVKEAFDPIIGAAQNDYMISLFQSEESISEQLIKGYQYYNVYADSIKVGFVAFLERETELYLSKFYLSKEYRGRGYANDMFAFICENAKKLGYDRVTLNVNKDNPACRAYEAFGMKIAREEKNDIGNGFYMDDYVYAIDL